MSSVNILSICTEVNSPSPVLAKSLNITEDTTEEELAEVLGIEKEQLDKILDEYAEKYLGGPIPEKNVFREIKSSESIDDRPEMLKLLRAIESPKIKAILVVEVQF